MDHQDGEGGWLEIRSANVNGFIRNRARYIKWELAPRPVKKKPPVLVKKKPAVSTKETETIRRRIAVQESEVREFTEKETAIIEGLNDIELMLNRMRARISALTRELEAIREGVADVGRKKERLTGTIEKNKDYVAARLNALYRMKMIGRMELVSMPDSMFDFVLQQNALGRILASDLDLLERQMDDMKRLATVSLDLEALEVEKKRLDATLKEQMRVKTRESLKRSAILKEIRKKKELGLAAVASLKLAAKGLENKIATLEPRGGDDQVGFSRSLGRLKMPVEGTIISRYGPSQNSNYSSFTFQTGIDISVDKGEPVRSVFKGEVLYAEWLKGYGNLIIINHGDSFYTLYAHVEEFFKKKGELVDTSEVIALAGDTGSIKGPCLHFEVRHHGKPVDPMKWLKKGA
ncbi:MAG: peptidoglycan DD-metalloendopeptidase family protein [Desulfobacterium sp.]|nr:peptidoglycan DD-metalloendopeptidase family protein [Desulfobacterium sp.]